MPTLRQLQDQAYTAGLSQREINLCLDKTELLDAITLKSTSRHFDTHVAGTDDLAPPQRAWWHRLSDPTQTSTSAARHGHCTSSQATLPHSPEDEELEEHEGEQIRDGWHLYESDWRLHSASSDPLEQLFLQNLKDLSPAAPQPPVQPTPPTPPPSPPPVWQPAVFPPSVEAEEPRHQCFLCGRRFRDPKARDTHMTACDASVSMQQASDITEALLGKSGVSLTPPLCPVCAVPQSVQRLQEHATACCRTANRRVDSELQIAAAKGVDASI